MIVSFFETVTVTVILHVNTTCRVEKGQTTITREFIKITSPLKKKPGRPMLLINVLRNTVPLTVAPLLPVCG